MVEPRLKSALWIKAQIRICAAQGITAVVARRGEESAGAILVKLNRLDGTASVLTPALGPEGQRVWLRVTGLTPVAEADAEAAIARAIKRDADLWVLEIEDRAGRHGLSEPVL